MNEQVQGWIYLIYANTCMKKDSKLKPWVELMGWFYIALCVFKNISKGV